MEPTLYIIARYNTDRLYGGPEEGGWWYTAGELDRVVLSTRDEDRAYEWVRRLNDARAPMQREFVGYSVVELPRRELLPELMAVGCHADIDWDDEASFITRWDVPVWFPEHRPHYC